MKFLSGKKLKLIVDDTILPVANTNRARTQRIKRFSGKVFWTKRKRNLYSVHYGKRVQFEELYYGVLVMVLCDENGVVYDVWFTYGSMHEAKAYRIRKVKSAWFRNLVDGVIVCKSKEDKSMREAGGRGCDKLCEEFQCCK
ncbi:MAG: hypothetical protein N2648_01720 [Aquificaceae bacterium]|nr:hypothetical protein [Aquificaceae bacterium]